MARWTFASKAPRYIAKDALSHDTAKARKYTLPSVTGLYESIAKALLEMDDCERATVEAHIDTMLAPFKDSTRGPLIESRVLQQLCEEQREQYRMRGHVKVSLNLAHCDLQQLSTEFGCVHNLHEFLNAWDRSTGKPTRSKLALLSGDRVHANLHGGSHLVARSAKLTKNVAPLRSAICEALGVIDADLEYVQGLLSLPGGLGQHIHRDGAQRNMALMVAMQDKTMPTRFVDASSLRRSARGGKALEWVAAGVCSWKDLDPGEPLRAGDALLFNTAWWHAGPGVAVGEEPRSVLFVPLTGGTRDRRQQTESAPKRARKL